MKLRRMTLDLAPDNDAPPLAGDVLTTARAAYVIVEIRPVESRVWPNRWHMELERLPHGNNDDPPVPLRDGARTHPTATYRPGERPGDYFSGGAT